MKKLTKFWGVFLAIVLASTLILSAAPVSAGTLSWGAEDLPDEFADLDGDSIVDMAVSGDGSTIYVTSNNSQEIKRSTNGGESWSTIAFADITFNCQNIAVAPDDPNYIACASANSTVYISDDAGANWDTLGMANDDVNFTVRDINVSVMKGSNHYVAVAGIDEGDSDAEVWSYKIGAIGADWDEISADSGFSADEDVAGAVAFSPNFYSDQVLVAVTADFTNDEINLQVYSYNQGNWNSGAFSDFPEDMQQDTPTDVTEMQAASIAMAPDYLGSDDSMRTVFVGLTIDDVADPDQESSGIFRVDNTDTTALKDEKAIYSLAFDGSLLVAGRYDAIDIYRSTDALDDNPSVSGSTGTKEPGGVDKVLVGIAGSEVVAGTSGDNSAFAYSEDNGKTFNDLSLIDTFLTTIGDVAVTPDGGTVYMITSDNDTGADDLSLWRLADRWERILSKPGVTGGYIVRLAPDDPDVVYTANLSGTDMYYSSGGGMDKWHTRVYKESTGIVDMAVEGDGDTVYILTTVGNVSKSTNRGFTWDSKKASKLSNSNMLTCIGEDLLVAGSSDGYVAYSTDGNSSWSKLSDDMGGAVQATATGLADGDFVIASANASTNYIYYWELGDDDEWDSITAAGDVPSGYNVSGIGLWDGVLYALAENITDSVLLRTLTPTASAPGWSSVTSTAVFGAIPKSLAMSTGTDLTKLWAIDTDGEALYSYKDSLATVGVDLSLPADDASIPFNPVSGASAQIIFTWVCPSDKVDDFDFTIATDSGFDEVVLSEPVPKSSGTWDSGDVISKIIGPGASGNFAISFMPDTTYYWKVRVDLAGPVRSAWSEVRSFTTGSLPEAQAPVIIQQPPAPVIEVPSAPEIILQPPEIILPAPVPAPEIVIPAAPAPAPAVPSWAIYAIIIIGAVLVIALIVLIMRTRRPV